MSFLIYISNYIIPFVFIYIVGCGILSKKNIFEEFTSGAKDGFRVVFDIAPTLIGLMVAIGILRASGTLDFIAQFFGGLAEFLHFPKELLPVVIVKMFSSSAATGLVLDIFKEYGPDSYLGRLISVIMSSTETIFYTMAVYFMAAKVKKSRYTLAGALVATLAGIVASTFLVGLLF